VRLRLMVHVLAVMAAVTQTAMAGPLLGLDNALPPIVEDSTRPGQCTITYLIEDISTNDTFAVRMLIAPAPNATPVGGRMPCPSRVPPRIGERALDVCMSRAGDRANCVFADMARGFERVPKVLNTAENGSRCSSDQATFIALACWRSAGLDVCNVGCGQDPAGAIGEARGRCESKHQTVCDTIAAEPVMAP
jgi:hypothetical protein